MTAHSPISRPEGQLLGRADIKNWDQQLKIAKRSKLLWALGTHGFLFVISLPVFIMFLWLLITAFAPVSTSAQSIDEVLILAVAFAIGAIVILLWLLPQIQHVGLQLLSAGLVIGAAILIVVFASPFTFTFENFAPLWDRTALIRAREGGYGAELFPSIWQAMANSALIAILSACLVVFIATTTGYYLSRYAFKGRKYAVSLFLLLHAFPIMTLLVPIFLMLNFIGLVDTKLAVILVIAALELPFAVFVMKSFFDAVPWSVEMSAMTDGASRAGAFLHILLPQVKGGMMATGFFAFLRGWEEYIFAQSLIYSHDNWTMSQFVFFAADDFAGRIDYGIVFAVGTIYLIPSIALYFFASRHIDRISLGGTKG